MLYKGNFNGVYYRKNVDNGNTESRRTNTLHNRGPFTYIEDLSVCVITLNGTQR